MLGNEKNSLVKICNNLKANYILDNNEITYVKNYFESELKINKDKDMLLKIKAEAEEMDYNVLLSLIFSILAMFFAAMSVIIPFQPKIDSIMKIVYLIIILVVLFLVFMLLVRFSAVKVWRKYVLVVVNQMIEKLDDQVERKHKKHKKRHK